MRRLSQLLTVALVGSTVLAMVYQGAFTGLEVVPIGRFGLTPFDLVFYLTLFVLAMGLLFHGSLPPRGAARLVCRIIIVYVVYQLLLVAPVLMITKGYSLLGALYAVSPRLSPLLVLFFALEVTRYWSGNTVRGILECAALVLLLVAVWRFATGTQVFVDAATGRMRVLWGGGSLLFGWLVVARLLRERVRIRDIALGVAGLVGVVLINHRSAYVALAVSFVAFMLVRWRKIPRTIGIVVAIVLLMAAAVYTLLPTIGAGLDYAFTTMLDAGADANTVDRVYRWRLGLEQFAADPFGDAIWRGRYYLVDLGPNGNYQPHNFVVQLLAGEGVVGFLLWSALLTTSLVIAFRNARRDHDSAVIGSYVVFYLTFCLFNTNLYMMDNVVLLMAPLGLILWRDRVIHAQKPELSGRAGATGMPMKRSPQYPADRRLVGGSRGSRA